MKTLELKGTVERHDPRTQESEGAAIALLSPEEFRALVTRLLSDAEPTALSKAA